MEFDGQVAVVTGAGRGLGRAHALMLASRGCRVVVNDLGGSVTGGSAVDDKGLRVAVRDELQKLPPSSEPADEVVAEIRRAGGEAVANYDSVEDGAAIVQTALDSFGQIDIVVCNAGIVRTKYFGDYDDNDWHTLMGVHLHGAFTVVRAAWPHFKEQDHGRIVLTGSSAGLYGQNLQAGCETTAQLLLLLLLLHLTRAVDSADGAAKNAMTGLARVLSVEGKRYHINVNVVCPAASSRMTDPTNLEVRRGPDSGKALPGGDAMDRMAPEYVSALVTYLCHHSCDSSGCFYHVRRALAPLCRQSLCLPTC